jgi:hypothetical protein
MKIDNIHGSCILLTKEYYKKRLEIMKKALYGADRSED